MNESDTRAQEVLEHDSILVTAANRELVSRMIRMFDAIMELPIGRYWLLHGSRPCMRFWRKSICSALRMHDSSSKNPILTCTQLPQRDFHEVYNCFLEQFKLESQDPARDLILQNSTEQFEEYAKLAAEACGLNVLSTHLVEVCTQVSPSTLRRLESEWDARCDLEWCTPVSELHDYASKIQPSQRKIRIKGSCYNYLQGSECDFETWANIAESLFLRYKIGSDSFCSVFSKDTARILEVSHDASYIRDSQRSQIHVDKNKENIIDEGELIDADELAKKTYFACKKMAPTDDLLSDQWVIMNYLLCNKRDNPLLLLLMVGDIDSQHDVSSQTSFTLRPSTWMHADMSDIVGILHVDLRQGVYPARVYAPKGASKQARTWIQKKFLTCALFQSFCQRWEVIAQVTLRPEAKK